MRTQFLYSRRALATVLSTIAVVAVLSACAAGPTSGGSDANGSQAPSESSTNVASLSGEIRVFAAASLTGAFDEIAGILEQEQPALSIEVVYDGSSTLATQIVEGAPADVFASADEKNMQGLVDAGLELQPQIFAANTLRIAVAVGNPLEIKTLEDVAAPGVVSVLCAPKVPCGAASATLLDAAGVTLTPASEEQNVTAVVTRVASGEADAGLVYATDIAANVGRVDGVVPEGADTVVNRYPIAVLPEAPNPEAAAAFMQFVVSQEGQAVLARYGFQPAPLG